MGSLSSHQFRNAQTFQEKQQISNEGGLPETQEAKINSPTSNEWEAVGKQMLSRRDKREGPGAPRQGTEGCLEGFPHFPPGPRRAAQGHRRCTGRTGAPAGGPRSLAILAHGHPSELRTLTVCVWGGCMLTPPPKKAGPNREVKCLLEQTSSVLRGANVHQKLTPQARGSFPDKLTRSPSGHVLDRGPGSFLTRMPTRPQTRLRRASAL